MQTTYPTIQDALAAAAAAQAAVPISRYDQQARRVLLPGEPQSQGFSPGTKPSLRQAPGATLMQMLPDDTDGSALYSAVHLESATHEDWLPAGDVVDLVHLVAEYVSEGEPFTCQFVLHPDDAELISRAARVAKRSAQR
jgi:hypothetical protein